MRGKPCRSRRGGCHGWDDRLIPLLDVAGVSTVRDEHVWTEVEPTKGQYDFDGPTLSGFMGGLRNHGIDPLLILDYGNPIYTGDAFNAAPANQTARDAFGNYSKAIVDHYPSLQQVEVWNEYNRDRHASGPAGGDPVAYAHLLKATYRAVNETDTSVTVLGGATGQNETTGARVDMAFWRGVLAAGGAESMDAMSIHAYRLEPRQYASDIAALRNLTREYNDGRALPLWVTEFGWSTVAHGVTPTTQSRHLVASHMRLQAAGVERAYWYDFRDDDPPGTEGGEQFGLLRHPDDPLGAYTPKPGFVTYAIMTRQLAGEDVTRVGHEPVEQYAFGPADDRTTVLFSAVGSVDVTIQTDQSVDVTTKTGATQQLEPVDGEVYLTIGRDPLYLNGNVNGIDRGAPVSIETDNQRTLTVALENDGDESRTATHRINGTTVDVTAAGGEMATADVSVPTAYRPIQPSGEPPVYVHGGPRVVDVVQIDGRSVGRLTTRVRAAPINPTEGSEPTTPSGASTTAERTETSDTTSTSRASDSSPATATDESSSTPHTPAATTSGPGFGALATLSGFLVVALLMRRQNT